MGSLTGKRALITGGASGIGRATALLFAREGAAVCVADLNRDGAHAVAQQILAAGGRAIAQRCDVSRADHCQHAVQEMVDTFGGLDVLLNHFDHAIRVAGPDHVGIGADWDGVGSMPVGMEDVSRLPALTLGLLRRGHAPDTVRKVLGEAFVRRGAVQCGFCTPGYVAATKVLLDRNPDPSRDEVVKALRLHWCRCTGYQAIVDAVMDAASILRGAADPTLPHTGGVGTDEPKLAAVAKALGEDAFVDDLRFDGMLHGAVRLSDHPRAVLNGLDTTQAAAMPGVIRVLITLQ